MFKELFSVSTKTKLTDCFKFINTLQDGLAKKIADYILTGDEASVLSSVKSFNHNQLQDTGVWFPHMYIYQDHLKAREKRIQYFKKTIKYGFNTMNFHILG